MIPRKPKSIYKEVAVELNLKEDLVESVVEFYWKEVRKQMTEPDDINISLTNLGSFEIRRKQVEYMIDKYRRIINGMKLNTYAKHVLFNQATEKLTRYEKLIELCNKQNEKKKQIRELQKNGKTV